MDQSAVTAASGLRSRMQALDLLSNNLANSNTSGYKLDREFYSLFSGDSATGIDGAPPTQMPDVRSQWTDFSQGTLTPTKNPLDLALTGQGFFVANGPSGPLYTRNGSFQLSNTGVLTTSDGYPVAAAGGTIQTTSQSPLTVGPDGAVEQDGNPIGQLQVVDFENRTVLTKRGNSYFVNSNPKVQPTPSNAIVTQGQVEGSNVGPAEATVGIVGLMRQFEMLQKAISLTSDMGKQAITELSRVGGGV